MGAANFYEWVEKLFRDNWTATPFQLDNQPFDETGISEYIRVTILATHSEKTAINPSPSRREHMGVVAVQVFQRELTGTRRSAALADTIAPLFRDVDHTESSTERWYFGEPSEPQQADSRDPAWIQHNVTIPYYREEYN